MCAVNKLHISEDRMVSHQQGVHALFQLASEAVRSVNEIPKGRRIKLSEEVQQFPIQEPILPQPLLDRMRRPSNALVLWQPPRPLSSAVVTAASTSSSSEEEEDQDNNNSSSLDLNNMPSFSEPSRPPVPILGDEGDIDMEAL
ncbi:hypothetical protein B566_EDAN003039 [Ephemera danica]|nr:hypothetical protein B566_EDAN003039 [Ephemera danica]